MSRRADSMAVMPFDIQKISEKPSVSTRYPFAQMQVGDAWFVPASEAARFAVIRSCVSNHGKRHHKRFSCTTMSDGRLRVHYIENVAESIVGTLDRATPPTQPAKVYPPAFASAEAFRTHLSHFVPEQRDYVPKEFAEIHSHIIAEVAKLADETGKRYYTLPQNDGRLIYGLLPSVESKPIFFTDESAAEPAVANAE